MSKTVVLCGSLGSTAAMWDPQRPALAGFEVIDVEHPGHGAAPVGEERTIEALAARVLAQVEGPFSFVGLSLGGAIGMRLAADHPERVERLVLACTAARFGEPAGWHERAATVRADGLEAIADAVLARWFTPSFDGVDEYRQMLLSIDAEGYARCCEALAGWAGDGIERIQAPTLLVAGDKDPSTTPDVLGLLEQRIPGSRLVVVDGAAHLVNVERADDVNRLLKEHLE